MAFAASDDPYRIVLRYYDPIQITYNIKYPVGDSRDEWTGPEDVPIGGVGVPVPGNEFGINPYISTQIYCVDPFVPFHGQVPGLGGDFLWNGGAMADTVSGYVSCAPWNTSGALQAYGDAVRWIATNGYRGIYNYGGVDDAESKASVARLNAMFPGIGPIDKEIAVMATKVAIWQTIAGDSIQIVRTTLDKDTARLKTFNALVKALVDEGAKVLDPAPRPPLPGEITATTFSIEISDAAASYDDGVDATYDYYGPMTVSASLTGAPSSADLSGMDKVFLTKSGIASSDVRFASGKTPGLGDELPDDECLYGTDRFEQYISGTGAGSSWTSNPFYLVIPKSRVPLRGDQLLVKAQAKAPDIVVAGGTPVVYAFAQGDVQDWNAIQAFIGGASSNAIVDLYAEDDWYTGDTNLGDLWIMKKVQNSSQATIDHEFTFAVYCNDDDTFNPDKRLNLADFPVLGALSVDTINNTFTLKNGGMVLIQGLPMTVSGGDATYEYYYWVEEVSIPDPNYETPHFELSLGDTPHSVYDTIIGPFRLDEDLELAFVTVTNTYKHGTGELIINKRLIGDYEDWGVDNSTVFRVRIKDVTNNRYLLFSGTAPNYTCTGNSGSSDSSTGDIIEISAGKATVITNLWANFSYEVEELSGNYFVSYQNNGAVFIEGLDDSITVENTFLPKVPEEPDTPEKPNVPSRKKKKAVVAPDELGDTGTPTLLVWLVGAALTLFIYLRRLDTLRRQESMLE